MPDLPCQQRRSARSISSASSCKPRPSLLARPWSSRTQRRGRWRASGLTRCTAYESLSEATMGSGLSPPSNSCRRAETGIRMNTLRTLLPITAAIFISTVGVDGLNAEETSSKLSPQALQEIAQVEAEIDRIEAQAIERLAAPPDNQIQQIELLGKLMLYDKEF